MTDNTKGYLALFIMIIVFIVLFPAWFFIWLIFVIGESIIDRKPRLVLKFWPYVFQWDFIDDIADWS